MVEEKVKPKILKAEKAYHDLRDAARILRNQRVIANSSIPKFKQKKFDDLATQAKVKEFNANQAFEAAIRKLRGDDEKILKERLGLL